MEAARQRVRVAAARKKEKERKAKEGASSSAPKAVAKGSAKRKADGKDDRPSKKATVTPRNEHVKRSPPKSSRGVGKGVMTSSGPVIEGPRRLLTHKDYAIEGVESFIKLTDVEPCDQLGTKDLEVLALFDLTRVCLLPWLIFYLVSFCPLTDDCIIFKLWCVLRHFKIGVLPKRGSSTRLGKVLKIYWTHKRNIRRLSEP